MNSFRERKEYTPTTPEKLQALLKGKPPGSAILTDCKEDIHKYTIAIVGNDQKIHYLDYKSDGSWDLRNIREMLSLKTITFIPRSTRIELFEKLISTETIRIVSGTFSNIHREPFIIYQYTVPHKKPPVKAGDKYVVLPDPEDPLDNPSNGVFCTRPEGKAHIKEYKVIYWDKFINFLTTRLNYLSVLRPGPLLIRENFKFSYVDEIAALKKQVIPYKPILEYLAPLVAETLPFLKLAPARRFKLRNEAKILENDWNMNFKVAARRFKMFPSKLLKDDELEKRLDKMSQFVCEKMNFDLYHFTDREIKGGIYSQHEMMRREMAYQETIGGSGSRDGERCFFYLLPRDCKELPPWFGTKSRWLYILDGELVPLFYSVTIKEDGALYNLPCKVPSAHQLGKTIFQVEYKHIRNNSTVYSEVDSERKVSTFIGPSGNKHVYYNREADEVSMSQPNHIPIRNQIFLEVKTKNNPVQEIKRFIAKQLCETVRRVAKVDRESALTMLAYFADEQKDEKLELLQRKTVEKIYLAHPLHEASVLSCALFEVNVFTDDKSFCPDETRKFSLLRKAHFFDKEQENNFVNEFIKLQSIGNLENRISTLEEFLRIRCADNPFLINSRDQFGDSALTIAVKRGDKEAVKLLLEMGADPNIRHYGHDNGISCAENALMMAVTKWQISPYLEIIKLLVEYNVNLAALALDKDSPVKNVLSDCAPTDSITDFLLKAGARWLDGTVYSTQPERVRSHPEKASLLSAIGLLGAPDHNVSRQIAEFILEDSSSSKADVKEKIKPLLDWTHISRFSDVLDAINEERFWNIIKDHERRSLAENKLFFNNILQRKDLLTHMLHLNTACKNSPATSLIFNEETVLSSRPHDLFAGMSAGSSEQRLYSLDAADQRKLNDITTLANLILEAKPNLQPVKVSYDPQRLLLNFKFTAIYLDRRENGTQHARVPLLPFLLGASKHVRSIPDLMPCNLRLEELLVVYPVRLNGQERRMDMIIDHDALHSLDEVRDRFITHELKALLTCVQNAEFFQKEGKLHPVTGIGATAFEQQIVSCLDGYYFDANILSDETLRFKIIPNASLKISLKNISQQLQRALDLTEDKIAIRGNTILINYPVQEIIQRLKARRINFVGAVLLDDEGNVGLADRIDGWVENAKSKGFTGPGGHNSHPYECPYLGIEEELRDEFNLYAADKASFQQWIPILPDEKNELPADERIYIVPLSSLKKTADYKQPFQVNSNEFVKDSEGVYSFEKIRNEKLPLRNIPSLDVYLKFEAKRLNQCLAEHKVNNLTIEIGHDFTIDDNNRRIPGANFGLITILGHPSDLKPFIEKIAEHHSITYNEKSECIIENLNPAKLFAILQKVLPTYQFNVPYALLVDLPKR